MGVSKTLVDIVAGEVAIVKGQEGPAAKECRKYGQGRFEDYESQGLLAPSKKWKATTVVKKSHLHAGQTSDTQDGHQMSEFTEQGKHSKEHKEGPDTPCVPKGTVADISIYRYMYILFKY